MKTTRRAFLQTSALASLAGAQSIVSASDEAHAQVGRHAVSDVNAFEIAKRHTIRKEVPGPSFVEGMLLGNGDVGVCAVVRRMPSAFTLARMTVGIFA